jgi:S-DNA-T family DNA segregation ATPase FtsK/SpoIIIE
MARPVSLRVGRASPRRRSRAAPRPWLSDSTKNELRGIGFGLLGVATLLSLVHLPGRGNLIGPLGAGISGLLTMIVGRPVAFCVPALLLWWGWLAFGGRRPQHSWVKYGGAVLLLISACALFGLPNLALEREAFLPWAGILGTFLVYDAPKALHLPRLLGVAGTGILFMGLGMAGLLLATDLQYSRVAARVSGLAVSVWERVWTGAIRLWWSAFEMAQARLWGEGDEDGEERRPGRSGRVRSTPRPSMRVLNPSAEGAGESRPMKGQPLIIDHDDPEAAGVSVDQSPPKPESARRRRRKSQEVEGPSAVQAELDLSQPYELPPLTLLDPPAKTEHKMSHDQIREISLALEQTLADFAIEARVTQVTQGPVCTRFELKPAPGVKITRIVSLQGDIAMALSAHSVRILAPIPGKAAVGIEVPNPRPNVVYFRDQATGEAFQQHESPLAFVLGKTIAGETHLGDLGSMPHLLIAGATGSGKSVCLNSIIASILFRQPPDRVKFMMIDPKRVELSVYDAIPHLIAPVVTDSRRAPAALAWLVEHMEERYRQLAEAGVRNIDALNAVVEDDRPNPKAMGRELKPMPHIIVIIDELADLMMISKPDVEENVQRIAQMARAVGIHLIVATQRPSVNIITGVIKANLPARIAFKVSQKVDSRVILDSIGAETLLGRGDMLYSTGGPGGPMRLQGAYIADEEIERLAGHIRAQEKAVYLKTEFKPKRSKGKMDGDGPITGARGDLEAGDLTFANDSFSEEPMDEELFRRATRLILQNRKASVSLIQRRLKIGFARAGRLMDMMEQAGIVGPYRGSKPREILVDPVAYLARVNGEEEPVTVPADDEEEEDEEEE